MSIEKRFFSIREAATYSSLSPRFLYLLCKRRALAFSVIGRRILVDKQSLDELIEQNLKQRVDDWQEISKQSKTGSEDE
jgi:excisionase family DNA binding protein